MTNQEARKTGKDSRMVASLFLILISYFLLCVAVPATHAQILSQTSEIDGTTIYAAGGVSGKPKPKPKPKPTPTPTPAPNHDPNYTRTATNTAGTSDQWSAGTNWDATPTSGTTTQLVFGGAVPASLAAGVNVFTNNDIAGNFQLNILNFTYAGPASGTAPTVTISGSPLEFISNAGTLPTMSIAAGGTVKPLLTISNNIVVTNNLSIAGTSDGILSGAISGSSSVTKTGAGKLTLSGDNSGFTGQWNVTGGNLIIMNSSSISSSNAVTLSSSGGFRVQPGAGTTTIGSLIGSGSGTIRASGTLVVTQSVDGTVSNVLADGGMGGILALTKSGGATLTLSGLNTYSGGTTINAGTLQMSGSGTLGSTSATLQMNGGFLDLNGTNQAVGALNGSAGTIYNSAPSGGGGAKTFTVGTGDTSGSFSGTITDHDPGGSGFVKLVKVGTGTETLTSTTSNYTGGTDINGGVLISNSSNGGALGRGTINVNSGGTLAGAQTIDSASPINVNSGGTLMPGITNTSGSFAKLNTGAVTLASGSTLAVDINGGTGGLGTGNGGAGVAYDQINVTGKITLAGSLSLSFGSTPLAIGDKFYIMLYTGLTNESGMFFNTTNSGTTYTQGPDTFLVNYADPTIGGGMEAISLEVTAIPEPGTWIVGSLALLAVGYTQRRRLRQLLARS